MRALLVVWGSLVLIFGPARAEDPAPVVAPAPPPSSETTHAAAPLIEGEREGTATVLHRDEVLHSGKRGQHLWPLLSTPDARINYFEVTGRGPLHFHPDADHRLYVLEGTVLVTCGTKTLTCTAGDFIVIPKGVRHCYDIPNSGDRALLLTLDAPPYDPKKTVSVADSTAEKAPAK